MFSRLLFTIVLSLGLLAAPVRAVELPDPVAFSVAIEVGNIAKAREWLDAGLPPDFEGSNIGTGLMIAAWEGNIPMMALFHSRGADVNKVNALGEQALLHAAWKGRTEAVRWLVERGARIDREGKQWSALHYAAFAGHAPVVNLLLERGANRDALSTNGSTPLMMAVREGQGAIIEDLLAAGARTDIVNEWGDTAATWAMRKNEVKLAQKLARDEFPRLAEMPPATFKPMVRSQPVPDKADALMAQARRMESFGRFQEAAKLYREAFDAIRRADAAQTAQAKKAKKPEPPRVVSGVTISARRADPTVQTAGFDYRTPALSPVDGAPKPGAGGTAPADHDPAREAAAESWLRQAREHEAAGRRYEALIAYRRASLALRGH
jgi:uncharacterized protein